MASNAVVVKFSGDTSRLEQSLDKVHGQLGGFGSKLAAVGAAIGGAFVADKVIDFGKSAVDAFQESARVGAQTEAVLKSTGGAANVTAGHVGDLANSLKGMSGVEDEAIQTGENMLLTFGNVQNRVGAGNDIFDQATKTMLDMSVAMGTDAKSTAIQLGKALQDPVKGVSALQRVGVTFTQQQKDQIAAMVKAGDVAGAQKVVLAELNKEFGGSAKAMGDTLSPLDRLRLKFGDLQEVVGGKIVGFLNKLSVGISALWSAFSGEGVTSDGFVGVMERIGVVAREVVDDVKAFFYTLTTGFTQDEGTGIENFALKVRALWDTMQPFVEWLQANWQPVLIAVGIAVGLLVAPFATVAAGLIYLYVRFEAVRDIIAAVSDFLTNTVAPAVAAFATYVGTQFGNLVAYIQQIWPQVSEAISHVMTVVRTVVETALAAVQVVWHAVGDDLLNYASTLWEFIRATVENAINAVRAVIQIVLSLINGDWGEAWNGVKDLVGAVWEQIKTIIEAAIGAVRSILGALASVVSTAFHAAWDSAAGIVKGAIDATVEFAKSLPGRVFDAIASLAQRFVELGRMIGQKIVEGVKSAIKSLPNLIIQSIPGLQGDGSIDLGDVRVENGKVVPKALGGTVAGGRPYLVGERGPELFVPAGGGSIVPNNRIAAGGGVTVTVMITAGTILGGDVQKLARELVEPMRAELIRAGARNGGGVLGGLG